MDTPQKKAIEALLLRFPWFTKMFSEKKLLCILAISIMLAGIFKDIPAGSAMVIGLGVLVLTYALIDIQTVKKLTSKWISWERYEYMEEDKETATQVGQERILPEVKRKLTRIIVEASQRKAEERAPEDYLVLAYEAREEKKYEDGLRLAYVGINLDPDDSRILARLYDILGLIYYSLKTYSLAENYYRKAIQTDSISPFPYNNLGALYSDQKKYDLAQEAYHKALELNPIYVDAHYNLGNLYSSQKKYNLAEVEYRKALELNPKDADSHNNLGCLYLELSRFSEAEDHIKKAIKLDPASPFHHDSLGELYMEKGMFDEAELAFKKAQKLEPGWDIQENLEKLSKLRARKEGSPDHPTLDLGKEKKETSQ